MATYKMIHNVTAEPMTFGAWVSQAGCVAAPDDFDDPGYAVRFNDGAYRWMKASAFERNFRSAEGEF